MAAITPAPKLLQHLGNSSVLVQTGRMLEGGSRKWHERRNTPRGTGAVGGWSGVGVGLGEVMY